MALPTSAIPLAGPLIFRRLSAPIPPTLGLLAAPAAFPRAKKSKLGRLLPLRNPPRRRLRLPLVWQLEPTSVLRLFRSRIPLRARRFSIRLTAPLPPPVLADPQLNTLAPSRSAPREPLKPSPPLRATQPAPLPAPRTPSNLKLRLRRSIQLAVPILRRKRSPSAPPVPALRSTTRWTAARPPQAPAVPHFSILRQSPSAQAPRSKQSQRQADFSQATSPLLLTRSQREAPAPLTSALASWAAALSSPAAPLSTA